MRHRTPKRWLPQWASQLQSSMASNVTTTTVQRGQCAVHGASHPFGLAAEDDGAPDAEQRHDRGDGERVEKEVAGVLDVPHGRRGRCSAGQSRSQSTAAKTARQTGGHELAQPAASVAPRPWVRSKVPSASKISNPVAAADTERPGRPHGPATRRRPGRGNVPGDRRHVLSIGFAPRPGPAPARATEHLAPRGSRSIAGIRPGARDGSRCAGATTF